MSNDIARLTDELTEALEPSAVLDSETFMQPTLPDADNYDLKPHQLKAAQAVILNDMTYKRRGLKRKTYQQLAEDLGISHDTLVRYRALPEFQRYVKDCVQMSANSSITMALTRLEQLADGSITGTPSIRAIEIILEIGGVYKKSTKHEVSVQQPSFNAQVSDEELARIIQRADADTIDMVEVDDDKQDDTIE